MQLSFKNRVISFPRRPLLMGIINVNDDSFCDDGSLDIEDIGKLVLEQISAGADIIDVGAESARTNREAISTSQEISRFKLFLEIWNDCIEAASPRDEDQVWPPILSINTWRSAVVEEILPIGGDILNDMSALPDTTNAELSAKHNAALLIMHSVGEPKVPHNHVKWTNVMDELMCFFEQKIKLAERAGLSRESIILDPGIDFAKQKEDNLKIYQMVKKLSCFGCPVLLPVSRKTVVGDVLGIDNPVERDAGSAACVVQGMAEGAHLFRVHNVEAMFDIVKMTHSILM